MSCVILQTQAQRRRAPCQADCHSTDILSQTLRIDPKAHPCSCVGTQRFLGFFGAHIERCHSRYCATQDWKVSCCSNNNRRVHTIAQSYAYLQADQEIKHEIFFGNLNTMMAERKSGRRICDETNTSASAWQSCRSFSAPSFLLSFSWSSNPPLFFLWHPYPILLDQFFFRFIACHNVSPIYIVCWFFSWLIDIQKSLGVKLKPLWVDRRNPPVRRADMF